MSKNNWLDPSVCQRFREAVNASPIFSNDEPHDHLYNVYCAAMDRVDSAVGVLNDYYQAPETEKDVVIFVAYAAMLKDAIYALHEKVFRSKPSSVGESGIFNDIITTMSKIAMPNGSFTDDVFFEYFRSLVLAHPLNTTYRSGRDFMEKDEEHFSPWAISAKHSSLVQRASTIGVRVYSNKFEESLEDVLVPFETLKIYVSKRYDLLDYLTNYLQDCLNVKQNEWRQKPVVQSKDPVETLRNVSECLRDRYEDLCDEIDALISYLVCKNSLAENANAVAEFRSMIIEQIPAICECVNMFDNEALWDILMNIHVHPRHVDGVSYYQTEKILSGLRSDSDTAMPGTSADFGLIQAEEFAKGYAAKWVKILPRNMSFAEIRLLVCAANFLEWREESRS